MKNNQSDYWNKLAKLGPDASVIDPNDSLGNKNKYIKFIRDKSILQVFSGLKKSSRILDFGCGSGNISHLLSEYGYHVHGIDISIELLKLAKNNCDASMCQFSHYDGKNIPIEANIYEGVLTYGVLCYIVKSDELLNILKQISLSMKPGAKFIAIEQTRINSRTLDNGYKVQRKKSEYIKLFNEVGNFKIEQISDLRSGHFPLIYLIRYGFIHSQYFNFIKNIDVKLMCLFENSPFDYRETAFIISKK